MVDVFNRREKNCMRPYFVNYPSYFYNLLSSVKYTARERSSSLDYEKLLKDGLVKMQPYVTHRKFIYEITFKGLWILHNWYDMK